MSVDCLSIHAEYRCEDCFGGRLLCAKCMVERHRDEPLHIIQVGGLSTTLVNANHESRSGREGISNPAPSQALLQVCATRLAIRLARNVISAMARRSSASSIITAFIDYQSTFVAV